MTRLIRYELFKLFFKRTILMVLVIFSLLNLAKIQSEYRAYSYLADGNAAQSWHRVYWELYDEYSGAITDENINKLLAVYAPLAAATADMTASNATDDPNTMTGNLYSDGNLLKKYYVDPMRYFYGYQAEAQQIAAKARQNAALFADRGQTYEVRKNSLIFHLYADRSIPVFEYREMYNYYLNYDFSTVLILLLCLYGIVGTFVCEKETQMDALLITTPNGGRKTTAAKLIAVSIFVCGVSLWFSALDFAGFALAYGTTEGGDLPVYAVQNFATASVNLNLAQYSVMSALLRTVGVWTLCLLLLFLSMFWKNALIPFVAGFGLCFGLTVLGSASAHFSTVWLKCVNPYSLLANRVLLGKTEFINLAGYPILSWMAAFGIGIVSGVALAVLMIAVSKKNCHGRRLL